MKFGTPISLRSSPPWAGRLVPRAPAAAAEKGEAVAPAGIGPGAAPGVIEKA